MENVSSSMVSTGSHVNGGPPGPASPRPPDRQRNRFLRAVTSLRSQLLVAILVPTLVAIGFAAVNAYQTTTRATDDRGVFQLVNFAPAMGAYGEALDIEVRAAYGLADISYPAAQRATDAKLKALTGEIGKDEKEIPTDLRPMVDRLIEANDKALRKVREAVPIADPGAVVSSYQQLRSLVAGVPVQFAGSVTDAGLRSTITAQSQVALLQSRLSAEQIMSTLAGQKKTSPADVSAAIRDTDYQEQQAIAALKGITDPPSIGNWSTSIEQARQLQSVKSAAVNNISEAQLGEVEKRMADAKSAENTLLQRDSQIGNDVSAAAERRIAVTIVIGILVLLLAGAMIPLLVRKVITPLTGLIRKAEKSVDDLPKQLEAVQHGAPPAAPTTLTMPNAGREIRVFSERLNELVGTTVDLATKEAQQRAGVVGMLRTVAHREAALVNRQLELLDKYERHEVDPVFLSRLFNLDHVTTQMRRMCDSLLVLGGGTPVRRTTPPLSLVNVVRGASSQIQQYSRVDLDVWYDPRVQGHKVSDLTLLVAELLDNATKFSHPDTRVSVTFTRGEHAAIVTIADQGIGFDDASLAAAQAQVNNPDEDIFATFDRLGLQTVAKLCARTGARVSFSGGTNVSGTRVTVEVPDALLVDVGAGSLRLTSTAVGEGFDDSVNRPAAVSLYGHRADELPVQSS